MTSARIQAANGSLVTDIQDGLGTRILVADNEPMRGSYSTFISALVPAALATDVVTIQGSATKIIRVRSILITGLATAASNLQVMVNRRSSANTGGTATHPTFTQRDNLDDAPTAVLSAYTANPSALGTLVGLQDGGRLNVAPAANGPIDRMLLQYGWINDKAPVLRGVADFLCIGLGGAAVPAGCVLDFNIVVSEE